MIGPMLYLGALIAASIGLSGLLIVALPSEPYPYSYRRQMTTIDAIKLLGVYGVLVGALTVFGGGASSSGSATDPASTATRRAAPAATGGIGRATAVPLVEVLIVALEYAVLMLAVLTLISMLINPRVSLTRGLANRVPLPPIRSITSDLVHSRALTSSHSRKHNHHTRSTPDHDRHNTSNHEHEYDHDQHTTTSHDHDQTQSN